MAIGVPSPLSVIAASAALPVICIVVVSLRLWTRHLLKTRLMLDDWLTLPALLLTIGMSVALIIGVRLKALAYPTPVNISSGPSNKPVRAAQIVWAVQMLQVLQLGLVKLSFLFFYRRIFSTSKSSSFGIVITVMVVLFTLWTVAFFFAFLFACGRNFAAWWISVKALPTKCIETIPFENGFAMSDFIMDFIIVVMPIPMILGLHMSTARKVGVIAMFAFGLLAVVASIVRLIIFYQAKAVAFKGHVDNDLLITQILFWSVIESNLALIAASLPLIQSLFRKISLRSVIRSLRNLTSLGSSSRGSRGLRGSRPSNNAITRMENGNNSATSHARMVPGYPEPVGVETYAMRDISKQSEEGSIPNHKISVKYTVTQSQNGN